MSSSKYLATPLSTRHAKIGNTVWMRALKWVIGNAKCILLIHVTSTVIFAMYGAVSTSLDYGRCEEVSSALALLGFDGFVAIDRAEPEFNVLSRLYQQTNDVRCVLVIGLGVAIVDYQLGTGGAHAFWSCLEKTLERHGFRISDLDDAYKILLEFMECRVNARLRRSKIERIKRFFNSGYANFLWSEGYKFFSSNPMTLWKKLAYCMNNPMDYKTIAFAMKVLDLISLISNGHYAEFPIDPPIPVDDHVARMSIYSGIIHVEKLLKTPEEVKEAASKISKNLIIRAWGTIAEKTSAKIGKSISVLRVDSLVWQLSKVASTVKYRKNAAVKAIQLYLVEIGINAEAALKIAEEMSYSMH